MRAESVNAFLAMLDRLASAIVSENPQLNGTASSEFAGRLNFTYLAQPAFCQHPVSVFPNIDCFSEQLHHCNQMWQALQAPLTGLGVQGVASNGMLPVFNFDVLFPLT